ncbi:hypothetical protein [Streptomyces sp. NPDC093970]|uniref:hypothetical protein n=1 Tax=Streptomyces sp. NPDC093970 TaxID=3155076 RepID=UPI00343029D4
MTPHTDVVDHPSRRIVAALPRPYEEAREHYESLVPEVDIARFRQAASWPEVLEVAEVNAPHGFMRYYRGDVPDIAEVGRELDSLLARLLELLDGGVPPQLTP